MSRLTKMQPSRSGTTSRATGAALVFMMPEGLELGGVTTWALRLADALTDPAARGIDAPARCVTIVAHAEHAPPARAVPIDHPNLRIVHLTGLPPMRRAAGDVRAFIPAYRRILEPLRRRTGLPCVVFPSSLGDAFGVAAALTQSDPDLLRVVGWQHSDIAYDTQVLMHYEEVLSEIVGVSSFITERLRKRLPHRAGAVSWLPHGAPIPVGPERDGPEPSDSSLPMKQSEDAGEAAGRPRLGTPARPLRLIYTGRMEHEQKRIGALVRLPAHLKALGISHQLTLLGDGPAAREVDAAIFESCAESGEGARRAEGGEREKTGDGGASSHVRRLGRVSAEQVIEHLENADCFVLSSRYEGLSVALLEAMSRGCTPIVTRTDSGAADVVTHGVNGMLVDVEPDAADDQIAGALAEAVVEALHLGFERLSSAARRTVAESYSIELHAERAAAMIDRAAASPARVWPTDRPCAFTGRGGSPVGRGGALVEDVATISAGSGSVPHDAAARLRDRLRAIAEKPRREGAEASGVVIHGCGRHTIELASVLAESPAPILGVTDDDAAKWGVRFLGWTVLPPREAATTGATDVVISSWMHADAVYARRGVYESQGLAVHHLYKA